MDASIYIFNGFYSEKDGDGSEAERGESCAVLKGKMTGGF